MKKLALQVFPYVLFAAWVGVAAMIGMSIDQVLADSPGGFMAGPILAGLMLSIPALLMG